MKESDSDYRRRLEETHTTERIRDRLRQPQKHSYLKDFIYGAVDGTVTTFAVVSSVAGAALPSGIVIIMGLANLLADGFSMAVSNFLGTRAQEGELDQVRKEELRHVAVYPDGEREEIRQIFSGKGFEGEELESAVRIITSNVTEWVNTMIREEHGMSTDIPSAWKAAITTFAAFLTVGVLPVLPFIVAFAVPGMELQPYSWSVGTTALAFFAVGAAKARFVAQSWIRSGLATLGMGGGAAGLAYLVGMMLRNLVTV